MPELLNYYKVLQIDPEADPEVITAAYRRLSHKYHPDLNRDAAAQARMLELNRAYEVLSNPVQRADYDRTLRRNGRIATAENPVVQAARAPRSPHRRPLGAPIAEGLPDVLDFGLVPPHRLVRRQVTIRNAGGGFLDGAFTSHVDWLKVAPASFKSNLIDAELVADTRRLEVGREYHGRLDLVYDGILTSAHVKVTVTPYYWWRLALAIVGISTILLFALIGFIFFVFVSHG